MFFWGLPVRAHSSGTVWLLFECIFQCDPSDFRITLKILFHSMRNLSFEGTILSCFYVWPSSRLVSLHLCGLPNTCLPPQNIFRVLFFPPSGLWKRGSGMKRRCCTENRDWDGEREHWFVFRFLVPPISLARRACWYVSVCLFEPNFASLYPFFFL